MEYFGTYTRVKAFLPVLSDASLKPCITPTAVRADTQTWKHETHITH